MCDAGGAVVGALLAGGFGFGGITGGFEAVEETGGGASVEVGAVTAPGSTELEESLVLGGTAEVDGLVADAAAVLLPELFPLSATKAATQQTATTTAVSA